MSAAKLIVSGVEGRYALALFDLAVERGELESVDGELQDLAGFIEENDRFSRLIASPLLSRDDRMAAVEALISAASPTDLTSNLLRVLARNGRLKFLPAVIDAFARLAAEERGEIVAEVTSAQTLTKAQLEALGKELGGEDGANVRFEISVDPDLIAGLVVRLGSKMMDGSLKTKLQNLRVSMKGVT